MTRCVLVRIREGVWIIDRTPGLQPDRARSYYTHTVTCLVTSSLKSEFLSELFQGSERSDSAAEQEHHLTVYLLELCVVSILCQDLPVREILDRDGQSWLNEGVDDSLFSDSPHFHSSSHRYSSHLVHSPPAHFLFHYLDSLRLQLTNSWWIIPIQVSEMSV